MKRAVFTVASALALAVSGCGDTSGEPATTAPPIVTTTTAVTTTTSPPLDLPTDPSAVILSVELGGGLVMPQVALTEMPSAILYGDGRVITVGPQVAIFPAPATPPLVEGRMSRQQMESLVRRAIEAGVTNPLDSYGDPPIADAAVTTFTVYTGDGEASLSVYALGYAEVDEYMTQEQADARRDLAAFATALHDAAAEVASQPHAYDRLAIVVGEYLAEPEPPQPELTWPLTDLATAGVPLGDFGLRCLEVAGATLDEIQPLLEMANQLTPWRSGEVRYQLTLRPLLPHETGCQDLA